MTVLRTRGGTETEATSLLEKASNEDFTLSLWSFLKKLPKDQRFELQGGEIGVEVSDGFDAAEVVFEGNVLIGGVRVLVG